MEVGSRAKELSVPQKYIAAKEAFPELEKKVMYRAKSGEDRTLSVIEEGKSRLSVQDREQLQLLVECPINATINGESATISQRWVESQLKDKINDLEARTSEEARSPKENEELKDLKAKLGDVQKNVAIGDKAKALLAKNSLRVMQEGIKTYDTLFNEKEFDLAKKELGKTMSEARKGVDEWLLYGEVTERVGELEKHVVNLTLLKSDEAKKEKPDATKMQNYDKQIAEHKKELMYMEAIRKQIKKELFL